MSYAKKITGVCAFLFPVLLATSCSLGSGANVADGPDAKLDYTTGSIEFPIDKFSATAEQFLIIDKANNILIEKCVHADGKPMIPYKAKASDGDNRLFGIWVKAFAEKYAYGLVPGLDISGYEGDSEPSTEESIASMNKCTEQLKDQLLPTYRNNDASGIEPAAQGSLKAYDQAQSQPEWEDMWDKWAECMTKKNIGVEEASAGAYRAQLPDEQDIEGRTFIAIADVECKDKLNLVQTLSNIIADYQNVYIQKNEAALMEQKSKLESALVASEKINNSHG